MLTATGSCTRLAILRPFWERSLALALPSLLLGQGGNPSAHARRVVDGNLPLVLAPETTGGEAACPERGVERPP